jgi:hypothetical protein
VGQERLGPSYFFISLVLGPRNSLLWKILHCDLSDSYKSSWQRARGSGSVRLAQQVFRKVDISIAVSISPLPFVDHQQGWVVIDPVSPRPATRCRGPAFPHIHVLLL